jgi:hypothetical protein
MHLELGELLGSLALAGKDTEDVEADGLGEGPALVTGLDTESGGDVGGEVLVALLVTGVLGNEVEVFTTDDQGACELSAVGPAIFHAHAQYSSCVRASVCRGNVRCILVDMTVPVRIRPRMETMPVKGHFLSM